MASKAFRDRVVAYVTRGDELLVFSHTRYSEAGVQVPAGHPEEGEELDAAVLREAEEETGLRRFRLVRYLGFREYDFTTVSAGWERRHFYHLRYEDKTPETWRWCEESPSDGTPAPVEYEVRWVKLREAELDWGHGDLLHELLR